MNRTNNCMFRKVRTGALLMLLLLASALIASCGDDEQASTAVPSWATVGGETRPQWKNPVYENYGITMSVQVTLQDTLKKYVSNNDLMAAFIQNETMAVTAPDSTLNMVYFPLVIAGSGERVKITLKYYCDKLHRIFTANDWATYDTNASPTDANGSPYVVDFTSSFSPT